MQLPKSQIRLSLAKTIMPMWTLLFLALMLGACDNTPQQETTDTTVVDTTTITQPADTLVYDRYWNDLGRFLAGMEPLPGSVLSELDELGAALEHRKQMTQAFNKKDTMITQKLREWSASEFPDAHKSPKTVFYPFSGPDFASVHTVYPNADHYIFLALEKEGNFLDIRQIDTTKLAKSLQVVYLALEDLFNLGFFVTRDMNKKFSSIYLEGALPILLLQVAREGCEIISARRVKLLPDGTVDSVASTEKIPQVVQDDVVTGFEVKFRENGGKVRTLHYFSVDLSDIFMKRPVQKDINNYLNQYEHVHTFAKSASFLMTSKDFGIIRNHALRMSDLIVQDDTGVGYQYFDKNQWDITLYGKYIAPPITELKWGYQADLQAAFKKGPVKPLNFLIGYNRPYNATSLIVARKRGTDMELKSAPSAE